MISVLHVDDEEYFLDITRMFLEKEGDIRVAGAGSAEEALSMLEQNRYDAIVSDYQMPGMDGIALLKHLRGEGNATPFIILTGRGREQVAIEALNSGADFYLQKGTDPRLQFIELRNLITQAVIRRHALEALRESEEKYRNLVERAHEGIIVIQDAMVKFCNRRTAEMWGGECREIVGRPYRDFIDPTELPRLRENYERRMAGKEVPGRYDTRLLRKDGTSFPVDLDGGDIVFDGRTADLVMFRDITERKMAEEALRESVEKYRALVERANDGIIVVQDGVVKFCNRKAAELWGGDVSEIVGRPYQDFIDPLDASRIRGNYERRMAGEEVPRQYDALLVRKDGSRFHGELNAGTLTFEGRPADLILFRDMTERRMAEEALKTANRKLNLLSSVTRHDMLNQLVVIVGYLELARESTSPEDLRNLVEMAARAAGVMRSQIEFTEQYQDVGVHSPVWQDLEEVIARAGSGAGSRNVELLLELDPVVIYADPLFEHVFSNLVENALNHGKKVTSLRFSTRITGSGLTILCEDDGIGIPEHEKEKIFSPGYGRKTGYGLFLVREILGITGATIREIGKEGKGALFEIAVPKDAYRVRA